MSASLVGSEMCIRDRRRGSSGALPPSPGAPPLPEGRRPPPAAEPDLTKAVSYTHLTLPTICSV
eukprot:4732712-Alexandrium_andersonii.AAC.1